MRLSPIALCTGLLLAHSSLNAAPLTVEERFTLLEQRLQQAEQRAERAESEVQALKSSLASGQTPLKQPPSAAKGNTAITTPSAVATNKTPVPTLTLNGFGDLKLYGDVEFNTDAASRTGQLTSIKSSSSNKDWKPGAAERWDVNGRILVGLDGYRRQNDGRYAGFSVQPLANMTGKMGIDDAAFFFGQEKDWQMKIGRYEAYDMFPLNQDTFIEYSGNTANDLYADGYGYIYMMKEGRGRSSDGGSIMVNKNIGDWYFELNTLFENGSSLYSDSEYHGSILENKKNTIYARPVIAWKKDSLSAAVAMETNLVKNAYGYTDSDSQWQDQSRRTGYGTTLGWNSLPSDPQNGIQANLNAAHLNAVNEKDSSIGVNALWHRFELGYIYAHNNIEKFDVSNINDMSSVDSLHLPGKYDIHTIHSSYQIPNIFDMQNFNLYLGAYASWIDKDSNSQLTGGSDDSRYGVRARFKYFF